MAFRCHVRGALVRGGVPGMVRDTIEIPDGIEAAAHMFASAIGNSEYYEGTVTAHDGTVVGLELIDDSNVHDYVLVNGEWCELKLGRWA